MAATFGEVQMTNAATKTNRALINVDITYNSKLYKWQVYVPQNNTGDIMSYLTSNILSIQADIDKKESLWAASPKTKQASNDLGQIITVPMLKEEIVHADVPDFEESMADPVLDIAAIKRILVLLSNAILANTAITQQQIDDLATVYTPYKIGKAYIIDEVFSYKGKLYRVVQAHTSQGDWLPEATPALYTAKAPAGVVLPFVQPTGASDAYKIGDKVTFNGFTWQSLINANVWSPTAYPAGWQKL